MKWISVKDELPPLGEKVVVFRNNVHLISILVEKSESLNECVKLKWYVPDESIQHFKDGVTHWMPLPEPPK